MTFVNVVIVGAGPAGIGVASLLRSTDIEFVILEKNSVGSSFLNWPDYMEMITPSFPSNAFGQMDLNSIASLTSPAFTCKKEHLSGREYSEYLTRVKDLNQIDIETNTAVKQVKKVDHGWLIETNKGKLICRYLVWAAGEFNNPQNAEIVGAEQCVHSSTIKDPSSLKADDFIVIGGYESGVQLAIELVKNNKKVTLINPTNIDNDQTSDPSKVLSPYTHNKLKEIQNEPNFHEVIGVVKQVVANEEYYSVQLENNTVFRSSHPPICATGFSLVQKPIEKLLTFRADGFPLLNPETDELFEQDDIYLAGPAVRHDQHIFCFIYKFRQRFGVIVADILNKEMYGVNDIISLVNMWKKDGLYLDDLSCCDQECIC